MFPSCYKMRENLDGSLTFVKKLAEKLAAAKPFGRFVGNGLDRSVLPCQKYDTAGKPRTAGCADGSRPIPTNIPKTDSFYTLHLSFQGRVCLRFSTFQQTLSIVLFCGFARGFPQFQHGFPHFHSGKMSKTCAKCGESPPRRDFLRFVQSCFTRCSFFGSML